MINRYLAIAAAAAAIAVAPLTALAHPILGPDGVLRFPFEDRVAPALFCRPLYVCDIVLEPGETVINVAIGDSTRWLVSPATSGTTNTTPHILVKPTQANLSTDLIVTTTKRAYYLDLHSANVKPMIRVGFTYPVNPDAPNETPGSPAMANMAMGNMAMGAGPVAPLDFKYQSTGAHALFPVTIYNDGKHTYLRVDPNIQALPVLFQVGPDGDQLVNYRVKDGDEYIVDAVPDRIALVLGSGKNMLRAEVFRKQ